MHIEILTFNRTEHKIDYKLNFNTNIGTYITTIKYSTKGSLVTLYRIETKLYLLVATLQINLSNTEILYFKEGCFHFNSKCQEKNK